MEEYEDRVFVDLEVSKYINLIKDSEKLLSPEKEDQIQKILFEFAESYKEYFT